MNLTARFKHVCRLTDDTGILEHALGAVPRRKEGYSTDDQARALWLCLEWLDLAQEGCDQELLTGLIDTYLSFLLWVQKEDGHFHNNIAYDRTKEPETPSDDCLGRSLWAVAAARVKLKDRSKILAAQEIWNKALKQVGSLRYPRGWAYALSAVSLLIKHHHPPLKLMAERDALTERLLEAYRKNSKPHWHWFEPEVTYSNGVIPWGLLWAYEVKSDSKVLDVALASLDFLIQLSLNEKGQIRPVGNRGWCTPESRALWDQQPIDVMKLALAASKAYEITGKDEYKEISEKCRNWFYGENDLGAMAANPSEGSGFDGLSEDGINMNQGAEATISYLLTEAIYLKLSAHSMTTANPALPAMAFI